MLRSIQTICESYECYKTLLRPQSQSTGRCIRVYNTIIQSFDEPFEFFPRPPERLALSLAVDVSVIVGVHLQTETQFGNVKHSSQMKRGLTTITLYSLCIEQVSRIARKHSSCISVTGTILPSSRVRSLIVQRNLTAKKISSCV